LKAVSPASARGAAGAFGPELKFGVLERVGRFGTRMVPAPAAAIWLTRPAMSLAAVAPRACITETAVAGLAAAVGICWKMSLAPPQTVTSEEEVKVPPRPWKPASCCGMPGGEAWLSVRAPPKAQSTLPAPVLAWFSEPKPSCCTHTSPLEKRPLVLGGGGAAPTGRLPLSDRLS